MKNKINYCGCGCGNTPKGKNKYIHGHNRRGCGTNNLGTGWKHKPGTIIKLKERVHTQEHNKKVGKALRGVPKSKNIVNHLVQLIRENLLKIR